MLSDEDPSFQQQYNEYQRGTARGSIFSESLVQIVSPGMLPGEENDFVPKGVLSPSSKHVSNRRGAHVISFYKGLFLVSRCISLNYVSNILIPVMSREEDTSSDEAPSISYVCFCPCIGMDYSKESLNIFDWFGFFSL